MPFACSICEQESTRICAFCTKDACDNHLCERCGCCSDCCECEVPLEEATAHPHAVPPADGDHAAPRDHPATPEATPPAETQPAALGPLPSEPPDTSEV